MNLYEYQRSGPSIDHGSSYSDSTFSNFFSLQTAWSIEAKFHVEPPWDGGTKVCSHGPGHKTNMAALPSMVKTFKNLLWNQKADDLESWYSASGTRVLPSSNDDVGWPILWQGQFWSFMLCIWKG